MMTKTIFKNTLLIFKYKNQNNSLYSYVYKTNNVCFNCHPNIHILRTNS